MDSGGFIHRMLRKPNWIDRETGYYGYIITTANGKEYNCFMLPQSDSAIGQTRI